MELSEKLPKPVKKLKQLRDNREEKNHKKLFYEDQFRVMVKNGNYQKAVELIWDESRNLNVRIKNKIDPDNLAQYCYDRLYHSEKEFEVRENCLKELLDRYDLEKEEKPG
jgi:hypothetical protein